MKKPVIMDHPLIQSKLSLLRDKNTGTKEFRELVSEVAMLMCYEATRTLPMVDKEVQTPVSVAKTKVIESKIAFVPILRAGLGMENGMLAMIPSARIGHVGVFRDPNTLMPVEYYCKLPSDLDKTQVIVLDPMLATGGSASFALDVMKKHGAIHLRFMCLVAAPVGLQKLQEDHPDVEIYCGALDEELNEHGYIIPGLGDAGDRIFGTK